MVQAIARRLQEKALGGLKPSTRRLLHKVAEDANTRREASVAIKRIRPGPGTVLVREWHGTKHQVSVLKEGFLYRPSEEIRFAITDRTSHHRHPMVRTAVLRVKVSD